MTINYPNIKTKLPGPKATRVVMRTEENVSPSYTYAYPLVVESASGAKVTDVDGNTFLDFAAGIAVCSTGHCHPKVVAAIKAQAEKLLHMSGTDFYYPQQVNLAEQLAEVTPIKGNKKVFFCNSGAEAVEGAMKLARWHTKRKQYIAFFGAFHGRTLGAVSLTASKSTQRAFYFPGVPGVTHVSFAYCYRCPYNLKKESCGAYCVKWIEDQIFKTIVPAEEVAAVIVEPIQGEGGYVVPPPEFHVALKKLCERHGILYVADEVQSGMGRTGKMFAIEHFGVEPDIICTAKGIASGMPLGAFISKSDVMNWTPGAHASTFGGNPVSCEAAIATIELLKGELMQNAAKIGEYMIAKLIKMKNDHELIGDVRGLGLMLGVELVKNRETKERASEERNKIVQKCFEKGLLLLGCGANTIRFCPPLTITKEEADKALEIFEERLRSCR
jgi:4-aminobutyrate aminotransferase